MCLPVRARLLGTGFTERHHLMPRTDEKRTIPRIMYFVRLHFIFNCYKHKLLKADKAVSCLHLVSRNGSVSHQVARRGRRSPGPLPHLCSKTARSSRIAASQHRGRCLRAPLPHLGTHTSGNVPSTLPPQPRSVRGLAEGYLQRKTWPASPAQKDPEFLHKRRPRNPHFDALTCACRVFSFKTQPPSFTCPVLSWASEQRNLCFSPLPTGNLLCSCLAVSVRNLTKPDCTS